MERTEKTLMTVPYINTFKNCFYPGDLKLLIDNIEIAGLDESGCVQKKIGFEVQYGVSINSSIVIYPQESYPKYMIKAERIMTATVLKLDRNDYITMDEHNGSYTFMLKDEN